jgi:glycosyltransferase involved in cell wall biosynthesis
MHYGAFLVFGTVAIMKISVVITCFNYGMYLAEAIASALDQTYPPHEVIVIDDGSTDDTPTIAESFGNRVQFIRQENAGPACAKNTGIRHASGDLVALLDADDRWLPKKLELQAALFRRYSNLGLCYSSYFQIDAAGNRIVSCDAPQQLELKELLRGNQIGNLTAMFPRKIVDEVGWMDASLPAVEDWDMWIRIAERLEARGITENLAEYRIHSNNISADSGRMFHKRMALFRKHRNHYSKQSELLEALESGAKLARAQYVADLLGLSIVAKESGRWFESQRLKFIALIHLPNPGKFMLKKILSWRF